MQKSLIYSYLWTTFRTSTNSVDELQKSIGKMQLPTFHLQIYVLFELMFLIV